MRSTSCPSFAPNARSCRRRSRCSARSRRHVPCLCVHVCSQRCGYQTIICIVLFARISRCEIVLSLTLAPHYFRMPSVVLSASSAHRHLHPHPFRSRRRDSPSWSPSARRSSRRRTCRCTRFSSCVRYCGGQESTYFLLRVSGVRVCGRYLYLWSVCVKI